MVPVEALRLALSKEVASIELYNKLYSEHPVLKELFLFLINEEEKHKKLIEEKVFQMTK